MNPRRYITSMQLLLIIALTISAGCGKAGFRDPITKFQDASSVVIASTRLYVSELNKVERDHYLMQQAAARRQIKLDEIEAVQLFTRDGLKARLDALDQLAKYGSLLSRLAGSDAPERVTAEVTGLGEALRSFSDTTSKLADADNKSFKAAVGPVAGLIGQVLSLVTEAKIRQALQTAIDKGEEPVNRLIEVIASDIEIAYQRKRSALSAIRVALVDQYNREMTKGTAADRDKLREYTDEIRAHEDRWEVFANASPAQGLDAMRRAHTALVRYARSAGKVDDLAGLVEAMETFSARARRLGQAVQALREL